MARIFQTGFEMGSKDWLDVANAGAVITATTGGAWSTYSFQQSGFFTQAVFTLPSTASEIYFGGRFYNSGGAGDEVLLGFKSPGATEQVNLSCDSSGHLKANSGSNLGTGATALALARWYYLEGHIVVSDSVGVFEVKIDGATELNITGADTKQDGSSALIGQIRLPGGGSNSTGWLLDDFYVNDTSGSQNTTYSGDIRISAYIPNAAGDVTGFTPTSGANYTNIDERPPNDATDLVSATGTTLYDLYNIPNTSGIATVQAVTLWVRAQKSDAGSKNFAHMLKSGSTENTGSDIPLSTSWAYYAKHYNVDPTDSAAWTPSKVDNLQIGVKAR